MKKGFINMLEVIFVLIALFIAFGILFPSFTYKTRWSEALILLTARDIIITADRIGNLYNYSFNAGQLSDFLYKVIPVNETNLIGWSEIEGTIKNNVTIACNCTKEQIYLLYNWTTGLTINGRNITVFIVNTELSDINLFSDVLLIWGYRDLNPFKNSLLGYINKEKGIVEMMDFSPTIPLDSVQTDLFGLKEVAGWGPTSADVLVKPAKATNFTYQAYKIYKKSLKGESEIIPEFCKDSNKKIAPSDDDVGRILVQTNETTNPGSCVIFNDKKVAKVAWIADFTNGNYNSTHTKLLISVLLAASNKKEAVLSPNMPPGFGYMTSYVNVNNNDMFEVYRFNLGLGYPY
jgi:hypothetical protein